MSSSYKWDRENTTRTAIKLNNSTDADIIELLNSAPNKQGLIKELLKQAAAKANKPETTKAIPKSALLQLIDSSISGETVFLDDIDNLFRVYGDTYEKDQGSDVWRKAKKKDSP